MTLGSAHLLLAARTWARKRSPDNAEFAGPEFRRLQEEPEGICTSQKGHKCVQRQGKALILRSNEGESVFSLQKELLKKYSQ